MPSGRWLWNFRSSRCFIKVYSSFTSPLALIEYWMGCTSPSVQSPVQSSFQFSIYLYCIQISKVWVPSWLGSNTHSKNEHKISFYFLFCCYFMFRMDINLLFFRLSFINSCLGFLGTDIPIWLCPIVLVFMGSKDKFY